MKTYGIFTAFSPNTRFDTEGLGRYLATFVKAAADRGDVRIALACPSWSRKDIRTLLANFDVPPESYEFVGPSRQPVALLVRNMLKRRRKKKKATRGRLRLVKDAARKVVHHFRTVLGVFLASRNILFMAAIGLYLLLAALIALPIVFVGLAAASVVLGIQLLVFRAQKLMDPHLPKARKWLERRAGRFDLRYVTAGVFRSMLQQEMKQIIDRAKRRSDIVAWYAPTAIWPEVHQLTAPKLICVPDMVISEFPVAFALDGEQLRLTFEAVQRTLYEPAHFVTYSERTKWEVVVQRHGVSPKCVSVVPHAVNDLSGHLAISGFPNIEETAQNYKERLLSLAVLDRARYFVPGAVKVDFKYIFYASQFRPSKNVITLLRAFRELHHRRRFGHKLILTGDPALAPDIKQFVLDNNLHSDVLFLSGLETRELAAAYSLAELAVNPSLSEGGMPFTFTEALSVGTPVVMADIDVTREVLTDPEVLNATVFDPYDWRALADKIQWALGNSDALLAQQRAFYDRHLSGRSWVNVVDEHFDLLDKLAAGELTQ